MKADYFKKSIENLINLIKEEEDSKLLRFHLKNALLKV